MINTIVFDWGGVLMRTEYQGPRHQWDSRLGLPPGSVESIVHGIPAWRDAQLGKISLDDYWQAVGAELLLDPPSLEELRVVFYSGDRLDTTLVSAIRQKQGQGFKVGLLSNNTLDLADTLEALQLGGLFDAVVISAQIGVMKPDPVAYQVILDNLGAPAAEAVMVDDFASNIAGARAMGMAGILFNPNQDWQTELAALVNTG